MEVHDAKKPSGDESAPAFLLTTLFVGLPFAGILATFNRAGGTGGQLAVMQLLLLVEGLTIAFFWRRLPHTVARSMGLMLFVVGIWAYMGACLMAGFGASLLPHAAWTKYAVAMGGLACAGPALVLGGSWANHQKGAQQVQTFGMAFAAVALALGFSLSDVASVHLAAKMREAAPRPEAPRRGREAAAESVPAHEEPAAEPAADPAAVHAAPHEASEAAAPGEAEDEAQPKPHSEAAEKAEGEPAKHHESEPAKHHGESEPAAKHEAHGAEHAAHSH